MSYIAVKHLHVACVVISVCGFALRGVLMLRDSPVMAARWVRVVPHFVDTALLGSAIALAVMSGQYPGTAGWLNAKLAGLVAYVVLGAYALRRGRTRGQRAAYFLAALGVYGWIVSVALTRDPRGFLVAWSG